MTTNEIREEIYRELYFEEGYLEYLKDQHPNETRYQLDCKEYIGRLIDKLHDMGDVA